MAPQPIEDIDFPALGDKILEVFLALWTLVCDLCLLVWSYVCQAFWTVWTYPPFETFRNEFVAALIALSDYIVVHPITSMAIAVFAFVIVPGMVNTLKTCLLHCLGFRRQGVLRGSYVANYQSTSYSGNVPRSSTFARYQLQGAKGGYRTVGGTGSPSWS